MRGTAPVDRLVSKSPRSRGGRLVIGPAPASVSPRFDGFSLRKPPRPVGDASSTTLFDELDSDGRSAARPLMPDAGKPRSGTRRRTLESFAPAEERGAGERAGRTIVGIASLERGE